MHFTFEPDPIKLITDKTGIRSHAGSVLLLLGITWLPLAVLTLFDQTFWTGDARTSFITSFDTQARLLVAMPMFLLFQPRISRQLDKLLHQFILAGIILPEDRPRYEDLVNRHVRFIQSKWTTAFIFVACYAAVFAILLYMRENTSLLAWQTSRAGNGLSWNLAGLWNAFFCRPFVLFLFVRWLMRILVWSVLLLRISRMRLNLFPLHPDLAGGLGFLGYSVRYFAPVAFAMTIAVTGSMADFILDDGLHLEALRLPAVLYLVFITLLFTFPMMMFTGKLIAAREACVYSNFNFTNGLLRDLGKQMDIGYDEVKPDQLESPSFSAVTDLNSTITNAIRMKYLPFTLRDLLPLWVTILLPFIAVILIEIPLREFFGKIMSFLV